MKIFFIHIFCKFSTETVEFWEVIDNSVNIFHEKNKKRRYRGTVCIFHKTRQNRQPSAREAALAARASSTGRKGFLPGAAAKYTAER